MSNSNARDALDTKHEHNREQRVTSIKRWVEYIHTHSPDDWGVNNRTDSLIHSLNRLVSLATMRNSAVVSSKLVATIFSTPFLSRSNSTES